MARPSNVPTATTSSQSRALDRGIDTCLAIYSLTYVPKRVVQLLTSYILQDTNGSITCELFIVQTVQRRKTDVYVVCVEIL